MTVFLHKQWYSPVTAGPGGFWPPLYCAECTFPGRRQPYYEQQGERWLYWAEPVQGESEQL